VELRGELRARRRSPPPGVTHGLALLLLLSFAAAAFACPACNEAAGAQGEALARGWSLSIFLMMGAPYALFGATALCIARAVRRKQDRNAP